MRSVRPLLMLLPVGLVLSACGASGPTEVSGGRLPLPLTSLAGAHTLAIQDAAQGFLEGYAQSDSGVELLKRHVEGPDLEDWVRWLEVQNRGLADRLDARLDLRNMRVDRLEGNAALAAVDATVTVEVGGPTPATQQRRFQSPMFMIQDPGDPLRWRVFDVVRDGRSMRDSIAILEEVRASDQGIVLDVASVYRFTTGTVVNVRIANESGRPVTVDGPRSILQVGGRFLGSTGVTLALREAIPPRSVAEGALNFPTIPLTSIPEKIMLFTDRVVDNQATVIVDLPETAFPPSETASTSQA